MSAPMLEEYEETMPVPPRARPGDPTWAIALLFPPQGQWSEEEYLSLKTNWIVELANGYLEIHPMATLFHQSIVRYLFLLLHEFVLAQASGEVFFAPLRVRLFPRTMREPDIVYLRPSRLTGNRRRVSDGADLAMEVVSDGEENRLRDLVTKRDEYARAGIEEYWIVDPQEKRVTVLTLDSGSYRVHGEFTPGMKAMSAMFPEFTVDVAAAFAAGEGAAKA